MTTKIQALLAAFITGTAGFLNWLATVPPEQQSGWTAALVELTPLDWRPNVGLATRFLMWFTGIYAVYKASHSGPQSPPTNKPE